MAFLPTPVIASEARQFLDRFVPRDDGSNNIASAARQFLDRFVPRDVGSNVIASEARQSMGCRHASLHLLSQQTHDPDDRLAC
jgi:hypothetical protein